MTDEQKPQLPAIGGRPQAIIPTDLDSVYRLATAISKSGIAPTGMNTPEQIMVAILHGAEIGLPPMASVQRIAVIGGRATLWGDAALGLIMASPAYEDHEESIEGEGDERTATCTFYRKGKKPKTAKFSVADAKRARLWGKAGPWTTNPDRMQQMRARGFSSRDAFPDVLGGLYLQEEMEGVDAIDVAPRASYGPPSDPPPPEQEAIQSMNDEQMKTGGSIGIAADMVSHPTEHHPLANPQKRKRATKAEMEARRATATHGSKELDDDAAKLASIGQDPGPDFMDIPPPMEDFNKTIPGHLLAAIAKYKTALSTAFDPDEIDTAWAAHITAIQSQIPKWMLDELTGLETKRAEEIA